MQNYGNYETQQLKMNYLNLDQKNVKKNQNQNEKLKSTFSNLVEEFHNAEDLARILMKRRERRGSIDFDFPESKIILNVATKKNKIVNAIFKSFSTLNAFNIRIAIMNPTIDAVICTVLSNKYFLKLIIIYTLVLFLFQFYFQVQNFVIYFSIY